MEVAELRLLMRRLVRTAAAGGAGGAAAEGERRVLSFEFWGIVTMSHHHHHDAMQRFSQNPLSASSLPCSCQGIDGIGPCLAALAHRTSTCHQSAGTAAHTLALPWYDTASNLLKVLN
jgi:hypothetical protein